MGATIAEKVLARASELKEVAPGDYVTAKIDVAMAHELAAYLIEPLARAGVKKIWDIDRVVMLLDHWVPAPTEKVAEMHRRIRNFAKTQGIRNWYEIGEGICHQILPEKGHVRPGELIVGTDSHTITYGAFGAAATGIGVTEMAVVFATGELWFRVPESIKFVINGKLKPMVMSKDVILHIAGKYGVEVAQYKSVEFEGSTVQNMSVSSRMTICNMSVEIGAKFGLVAPDQKTIAFLKTRTRKPFTVVKSDSDAAYEKTYEVDVSDLEPQVACPHSVDNVKSVNEVQNVKIDQALLGSCTNGRLEDLEVAAQIVRGKKVHPDVRFLVIPASREVYKAALGKGLIDIFIDAGGVVCNPTCGPCLGGHLGVLADGEKCIASTNRNFKGRMGSDKAEVYLASPATVAASAVAGKIANPRMF